MDLYFLLKTLTIPIFREIEEGRVGKGLFSDSSLEIVV
jgi:hypothetical protein